MKIHKNISYGFVLLAMSAVLSCKKQTIIGVKSNEVVAVYFPAAQNPNGLFPILSKGSLSIDPIARTVGLTIPIYRGGFLEQETFTVDIAVDNRQITSLISSGALPVNTVPLDGADYTLDPKVSVSSKDMIMKGAAVPVLKLDRLDKYAGKTIALGVQMTNPSKYKLNEEQNTVVVYLDVDVLKRDYLTIPLKVINAGFENGYEGWVTSAGEAELKNANGRTGKDLNFWTGKVTSGHVLQTINNLPNGNYTVSAWYKSAGTNMFIYANGKSKLLSATTTWTPISLDFQVAEKKAEFGFKAIGATGNFSVWEPWCDMDDFTVIQNL
ncbi:hypothetical protein AQ505_16515 [Pedobacter sp. PACM 27299]|uniref:hypothetical protein n=1 Tax=Pedobacter sp. PACM 27299 TaxID=1727164 RepID=UPI0007063584|nr:hypothetical protein [Pedobacter sp. PACM 27299]ALL06949.1 hypothetical protein AQ505_16515 [Pedobacter sp. PACM 27299]